MRLIGCTDGEWRSFPRGAPALLAGVEIIGSVFPPKALASGVKSFDKEGEDAVTGF